MIAPAWAGPPPCPETAAARPRVLWADPFWVCWTVSLEALRHAGMTVITVMGGGAALDAARQEPFTVALVALETGLDGGPHGLQVASALAELEPAPQVLFLTASLRAHDAVIHLNYRAVPVVRKDEPAALVSAVHAASTFHLGVDHDDGEA